MPQYVRTWMNRVDNGGGDLLRNTPDGWVSGTDEGQLWWRGSDQLRTLLAQGATGHRTVVRDGIVYTIPIDGTASPNLPAVARATSLICDTLAGLPWRQVRGHEMTEAPAWVTDPQMLRPDDRISSYSLGPNPLPGVSFWSQAFISAVWAGYAVLWTPFRGVDGQPRPPLVVLNPDEVTVRAYPRDGKEAGVWLDDADGGPIRLREDEAIVIPGEGPYDRDNVGQGVLRRFRTTFDTASKITAYAGATFGAGVPAGYLKSTNPNLTKAQAEELRSDWMAKHGDVGERGVAVLNAAVSFEPIAFSPVDAALIESAGMSISQIALAFGLEPYMLGVSGAPDTYANIVDRQQHFATFTLLPWARRFEDRLSAELPRGTSLRLDMRALLRADPKTRYEGYALGIDGGWLTVDEVRALEDLPPLEGPVDDEAKPEEGRQLTAVPEEESA